MVVGGAEAVEVVETVEDGEGGSLVEDALLLEETFADAYSRAETTHFVVIGRAVRGQNVRKLWSIKRYLNPYIFSWRGAVAFYRALLWILRLRLKGLLPHLQSLLLVCSSHIDSRRAGNRVGGTLRTSLWNIQTAP